jgi:hypothetical protein
MMITRVLDCPHPTKIECALRDFEPCDGLSTQICFRPRFLGGCGHDVDKPVATQPTLRLCHIARCLLPRGELVHLSLGSWPSLALQTTVGLRIDGTKIALVPGTEAQLVVFCEVLEARVHPVDADPRFLKILLTTRLVEIRCNSRKFSRDNLFCSSG